MPTPVSKPTVGRAGETLRFAGALTRGAVAALWPQSCRLLEGARGIELTDVPRVDSAGVAFLAELAARMPTDLVVIGEPEGFRALCAAYRLGPTLSFT